MSRSLIAMALRMSVAIAATLGGTTVALAEQPFSISGAVRVATQNFITVRGIRLTFVYFRGPDTVHVGDAAIRADKFAVRYDDDKFAGVAATGNVVATVLGDPVLPGFKLAARSALYLPGAKVRLGGEVHMIGGPRTLGPTDHKGRPISVDNLSFGPLSGGRTEILSWKTDSGSKDVVTTWPVGRSLQHPTASNGRG